MHKLEKLRNIIQLREWYENMKANPHEAARANQCFNCKELETCERGGEAEDENGMCRYYKPFSKE